MNSGLGDANPTLLLREKSVIHAPYPYPYNLRYAWNEAELWVFSQMRFGNHPLAIENFAASMDEGLLPGDPYGHDFIEASKRIVRNLARNEVFQELPSLEEYDKILEKGNWSVERVKFSVMMCNRFEDHEMLRRCCMDAYTAHILARFPVLDEESRRILQLEEQNIIEAVENTRRVKDQVLKRLAERRVTYPMALFGDEDIYDGPLRQVNLFSSGLTGLGHGNAPPYLDEDAVRRRLYWNQAMRDRSPSPSRRVRRAIDEQMVLRSGGTKEDLPDRCEILAVLDEDMLI